MKKGPAHRRQRQIRETAGALLRALLLVGPIAGMLVGALASAPGARSDRLFALDGAEGLDRTTTGSIGRPSVAFPAGGPLTLPNGGPCLRFPDGSQRGAC